MAWMDGLNYYGYHILGRGLFFSPGCFLSLFFAFPCCIESSRVYDWLLLVQFSIGGLCESTLGGFFFLSFLFFFQLLLRCGVKPGQAALIFCSPKNLRCNWIKSLTRHRNLVTEDRQLTSDPPRWE